MVKNSGIFSSDKKAYPLFVSIAMIIAAIALSFVDLAFLNDVIGKILDLGSAESMLIAFALGLIGVFIMGHHGTSIAHGTKSISHSLGVYSLWILLGIVFVIIRLFSATILQLNVDSTDEPLITILSISIRQVDLVIAPLMLFLYIATGLMIQDGFKNLFQNPEFDKWIQSFKEARKLKKDKEQKAREKAEAQQLAKIAKVEKAMEKRTKEIEDARTAKIAEAAAARIKAAATGNYSYALTQYREKEKEVKEKYQRISKNIEYIRSIDKQERDFETKIKPGLLKIVHTSIVSVQNSTALLIRKKNGEDIRLLRDVIESYNSANRY